MSVLISRAKDLGWLCFQVQACQLEHGRHDGAANIDVAAGFGSLESALWNGT